MLGLLFLLLDCVLILTSQRRLHHISTVECLFECFLYWGYPVILGQLSVLLLIACLSSGHISLYLFLLFLCFVFTVITVESLLSQDVRHHVILRRKWLIPEVWLKTSWNSLHRLTMHRLHSLNMSVLLCVFVLWIWLEMENWEQAFISTSCTTTEVKMFLLGWETVLLWVTQEIRDQTLFLSHQSLNIV